jgi:ABC-2 type transport system ATP-binding protein
MELRICGLSKTYPGGVRALRNVTLTIGEGMFGLLGPNGSGKSTLMRTIAALQDADAGTVTLDDIDVLREKQRVRRILGYLPQEFGVYPDVSCEAMLHHFAALKGIAPAKRRREVVEAILSRANLLSVRRRKLGTFSGGMKQRFGIAVALLGDPRIIIVDEPTAGLDPEERVRFLNLLSEIGEKAVVIVATHIVDDVSELCTRMAIIHEGEVRSTGNPLEEIAALKGRIWRRLVDKSELPECAAKYSVVSTKLFAGKVMARVFGETAPDPSFQEAEPSLEDVYFSALKKPAAPVAPPAA